jgi:hypothetical protein
VARGARGQSDRQSGIRAVADNHGVRAGAAPGARRFEIHHISFENKLLIRADILQNWHDFSRNRLILSFKIQQ